MSTPSGRLVHRLRERIAPADSFGHELHRAPSNLVTRLPRARVPRLAPTEVAHQGSTLAIATVASRVRRAEHMIEPDDKIAAVVAGGGDPEPDPWSDVQNQPAHAT